ncbi:hypothetical protein LOK49_LG04G01834 [Camellia lanceoleosa]|uniref:Uncharacterized protein n=1 Tax=Camellia lanceoleosa TaxID=1840588 RepID=A0ACC0I352_9ERIC|nr:hypothetical protein LOK49_LG04G01834 [Camellia lanceoleosa]
MLKLLKILERLLAMNLLRSLLPQHHHQQEMLVSRFQQASQETMRTTIIELMARTLATSSRIGLQLKSMQPQVVDLPSVTFLVVAATNYLVLSMVKESSLLFVQVPLKFGANNIFLILVHLQTFE